MSEHNLRALLAVSSSSSIGSICTPPEPHVMSYWLGSGGEDCFRAAFVIESVALSGGFRSGFICVASYLQGISSAQLERS